jgi:hypothetical protein
MELQKELASV